MHSHPAKQHSTVAINALWCLLIALALLAFPLIARQARLHGGPTSQSTPTNASAADAQQQTAGESVLLTQSDPTTAPK